MAKSLVEMTSDIVSAQAGSGRMSPEELSDSISKVYTALLEVQKLEKMAEQEPEESGALAQLKMNPEKSITRSFVICLECGMKFKQLTARHLATHGISPSEYRAKWGFTKRQPLVAKQLSAQRRKTAIDNQLGERLAAARRDRLANR
jgi:predicted transcriptional regulator